MQTRRSPSLVSLHRMAALAGIPNYHTKTKSKLRRILRCREDYDGLSNDSKKRRRKTKKLERSAQNICNGGKHEPERAPVADTDSSLGESGGSCDYSDVSSRKKCRINGANDDACNELNKEDPILYEPIGPHCYIFNRPAELTGSGSRVAFNICSLIDYLLSSGRFEDPVSRLPFTMSDLREIDNLAASYGLQKQSVVEAKLKQENSTGTYADARFRDDALQGLDRLAGEQVGLMVTHVEEAASAVFALAQRTAKCSANDDNDLADGMTASYRIVDDCQMRLATSVFPVFADLYAQLHEADPRYARVCMSHYKSYVKGPPNKPFKDTIGMLRVVQQFLHSEGQYAEDIAERNNKSASSGSY